MQGPRRDDITLVIGLTVAALVIFQWPIRYLLEVAHDVEDRYGLALVPGLVILGIVLLINYLQRRSDQRLEAGRAEVALTERGQRAEEMSRLVKLGQALAMAKSMDGLRDVLRRHLPELSEPVGGAWALIRMGGKWDAVAGGLPGTPHRASPVLEALADRVLQLGPEALSDPEGAEWEGHVCFPLIVGETAVGVLGVRKSVDETHRTEWRRAMASVAALLAISARNVLLLDEIQEHGVYDGLTGCFNRTHGMKVLDSELQRARRAQTPFSLIMFDLDYFKSVNDRYGHLCGDAVLTAVGTRMRELLRNSDVKCRYGGEEFLVLLPDTPYDGATHVAESLRKELSQTTVVWNGETVSITASVGVAVASVGELDARALIGRADTALYRAKNEGRNRVCVEAEPSDETAVTDVSNVESFPESAAAERRRARGRQTEN